MVTGVEAVTALVFTGNVALVDPAATVTLDGTVAEALLLERLTMAPPLGAAPLRVTVPVEEEPPFTLPGLSVTDDSTGGGGTVAEPPPQEWFESATTRTAVARARLGRRREAGMRFEKINTSRSQAMPTTNTRRRSTRGPDCGKGTGGAAARGSVVKVTVALAGFDPSKITEEGDTVHAAPCGAPVQLQLTV
jgi:hypothetical protein